MRSRKPGMRSKMERSRTHRTASETFSFLKKRTFIFLERVLDHYHLDPHSLQESSERSKHRSSRDLFQYNLTSSIEQCAPIFCSPNYDQKSFFQNHGCQPQGTTHRRFRHFWRHYQRVLPQSCQF